jgi:hypothetical protein
MRRRSTLAFFGGASPLFGMIAIIATAMSNVNYARENIFLETSPYKLRHLNRLSVISSAVCGIANDFYAASPVFYSHDNIGMRTSAE